MAAIKRQELVHTSGRSTRQSVRPIEAATRKAVYLDAASGEIGERRTALAYEPGHGRTPVGRISVEFDERGQWAVVVDGVVLRYLPDALTAVEDARRLENVPSLAATERDRVLRRHARRRRRR